MLHDVEMQFVSIISDWLQQSVRNDASEENKYCVVIVIQQLHYNLISYARLDDNSYNLLAYHGPVYSKEREMNSNEGGLWGGTVNCRPPRPRGNGRVGGYCTRRTVTDERTDNSVCVGSGSHKKFGYTVVLLSDHRIIGLSKASKGK